MKFACPKCNTRYSIADEKVPPAKTLRFPCKKCGNVIRLRRKGAKKAAPKKVAAPKEGATQVASLAEINKLRSQAARPVETRSPGGAKETTRVASVSEIRGMVEQSNLRTDGGEEPEWYVLVDGKQQGPITKAALFNQLHNKEIDKRTYIWRDGMGDWKRIGKMEEFQAAADGAGDAAWRVMAPINDNAGPSAGGDDEFSASTVSIDVRQLQAQ